VRPRDLSKAEDRAALLVDLIRSDDHRLHYGLMFVAKASGVTEKFANDSEVLALALAWSQILLRWVAGDAAGQPENLMDQVLVDSFLSFTPAQTKDSP
jgi:hypothetical protein